DLLLGSVGLVHLYLDLRRACIDYFSWHGALRDLHSFPTRRSSDLFGRRPPACQETRRLARFTRSARRAVSGECPRMPVPLLAIQDRKSTRLNSSHVSISYAVFCLKKKTAPDVVPRGVGRGRARDRR